MLVVIASHFDTSVAKKALEMARRFAFFHTELEFSRVIYIDIRTNTYNASNYGGLLRFSAIPVANQWLRGWPSSVAPILDTRQNRVDFQPFSEKP